MKKKNWIYYIFIICILGFSFLLKYTIDWYNLTFNVTIKEILYTITSPLKGADTFFLKDAVLYVAKRIWVFVIGILLLTAIEYAIRRRIQRSISAESGLPKYNSLRIYHTAVTFISLALFAGVSAYLSESLKISEYINDRFNQTTIYEERYVAPSDTIITPPAHYPNLIWISLESMENTYADRANQGIHDDNYIPNLTEIARTNINFSQNNELGGWRAVSGTTWTMASLFATTSGLPFSFPIDPKLMKEKENFASGVESLGDVLEYFHYNQEYLCGSDNSFAGCGSYFRQHGNYALFDYVDAIKGHYIPEDYKFGWGLEDAKTYEFAKSHILELAKQDKPFNFMMSTIDTHPNGDTGGFVCSLCESKYPTDLENVLNCTDRQISDFIKWCSEQDFYENTVIVICGDHLRMDKELVQTPDDYERTVYDAFINVDKAIYAHSKLKNRDFCAMDMFPTVLGAMGFEIKGNRLGLGTNLFSDQPTLIEEMGYENFEHEISKYSAYYVDRFE